MKVETILSCYVGKLCASEDTVWMQNVAVHYQDQQNTLTIVDDAKVAFVLTTIDEARLAIMTLSMKMLGDQIKEQVNMRM